MATNLPSPLDHQATLQSDSALTDVAERSDFLDHSMTHVPTSDYNRTRSDLRSLKSQEENSLHKVNPKDDDYNGATQGPSNDDDRPYTTFTPLQCRLIIMVVAFSGALAPFASNIFLPALTDVARDLNTTVSEINVAVSVFMIGLATAPSIWGPMADQFGRRYIYGVGTLICTGASAGCALASSSSMLLGMRFLQAFGGSCPLVLGAGTISDVYEPAQRGTAMGMFFGGLTLGPVLGTIIGGYLAEALGWRWTFWLTTIISGVFCVVLTFFVPETHRGILSRKQQVALKGLPADIHLQPPTRMSWKAMNIFAIMPALKFPYVWVVVVAQAALFGSFYAMNTSISILLKRDYNYSTGTIGLTYLAVGAGNIVGSVSGGLLADYTFNRQYRRLLGLVEMDDEAAAKRPMVMPFEHRLIFPILTTILFPLALIAYGWVMHFQTFIAFPLICEFIIGFSMNGMMSGSSTYLIDIFTIKGASITSVANLIRCLYCALWTGVIELVMNSWGTGWAFTFLGLTCLMTAGGMVLTFMQGMHWRVTKPPTSYLDF
ncbi:hypothetical protein H4R34_004953 [Dimargaris verticillata]|uniref:Major facilitator superfamily (MFS) profile domain-containing protein n=1 Tax=Dimargaris verticillata TaxID=2761393 RepID=A0A9W8B1J6_9FUNG|nr:hypothetical protein H4R34_004953 [Dimargaris verticillata]